MSWRLEERDLSGAWVLRTKEVELIIKLCIEALHSPELPIYTYFRSCLLTTFHLSDDVSVDQEGSELRDQVQEFSRWIAERGAAWFTHRQKSNRSSDAPKLDGVSGVLTDRLQAVANLYPRGSAMIDIGTDHAILPIALIKGRLASVAAGIDIASKPLLIAARHLDESGTHGRLALVCGDGIKPFTAMDDASYPSMTSWVAPWNELHTRFWRDACSSRQVTVTICGVGGQVAAQKIAELPSWVSVVIVQANNDPSAVDRALAKFQRSAHVSNKCHDVSRDPMPLWSIFASNQVSLSITLERTRLFVTKRVKRVYVSPDSEQVEDLHNDQLEVHHQTDQQTMSPGESSDLWLWYWVQLSRNLKVLTLTPPTHPSCSWKSAHVIEAVTLWLNLRKKHAESFP